LKQGDLRDIFKKASKNISALAVVVSPDPLCPTPTSSAMKPPVNTAEESDDPEPADKGDKEMEYSSD
jgi:hypothetical protein